MAIERTIVLPLYTNEGKSQRATVEAIKRQILRIAGGYSETKQTGYWIDEATGKVCRDVSLRVVTCVDERADAELALALPDWCEMLHQICLFTQVNLVDVSFVYPRADVGKAS